MLHSKFNWVVMLGYVTSILVLSFACLVFLLVPRLQNTRVRIHMNLFISIILRLLTWSCQILLYGRRFGDFFHNSHNHNELSVFSRITVVFGHYFELTDISWFLIEGWYFHTFINFQPSNIGTKLKSLVVFGWGLPLIIITIHALVLLLTEDTIVPFWWNDEDAKSNIIIYPKLIMVLVNLYFFIYNARMLFEKIARDFARQSKQAYLWKWIKSTSMLMPLFGAYNVVFCLSPLVIRDVQFKVQLNNLFHVIYPFHGILVASLYCYTNNEVKNGIKRLWKNWKAQREIANRTVSKKCPTIYRYNHCVTICEDEDRLC